MRENIWFWAGFMAVVVVLLAFDLGLFRKKEDRHMTTRAAVRNTAMVISAAMAFGVFVWIEMGPEMGIAFFTGYIIEESMSVDNLFVFILLFSIFNIPDEYQHEALFYGIVGALVLRAVFVFAGAELLERFDFVIYIFGALLVFAAFKTIFKKDGGDSRIARFLSKHLKTSPELDGGKLFTVHDGKRVMTPIMLCIIVIELSDMVFALDSIPAVLAITTDRFIVYTSNIFAILGLRSLFFAIKGSLVSLRYLKYGLGLILMFIGAKMMLSDLVEISIPFSLAFILTALLLTISASLLSKERPPPAT